MRATLKFNGGEPAWYTDLGLKLRNATDKEWAAAQASQCFEWTAEMVCQTGPLGKILAGPLSAEPNEP